MGAERRREIRQENPATRGFFVRLRLAAPNSWRRDLTVRMARLWYQRDGKSAAAPARPADASTF
jgi:hypothetical protein